MRGAVSINLASEPFHRDRPILVALMLATVVLAGLLATQIALGWVERGQRIELQNQIIQLENQLGVVRGQRAQVERSVRDPENAEAVEYAVFLNGLLRRKGISWTRIFDDLEQIVPHNVRLISVRPQVNLDNQIQLDMQVGSPEPQPVIQMLMNLEASVLFGAPAVTNLIPPSQSEPQYRYRVNVNYAPRI